jgi:hypothetical protein
MTDEEHTQEHQAIKATLGTIVDELAAVNAHITASERTIIQAFADARADLAQHTHAILTTPPIAPGDAT